MLVIRLQRRGKKNQPFFWIILAEKTAPVKGKYIERLGYVNPIKKESVVNGERVKYWISKGVEVSDTVYNLLIEKNIIDGEKRKIKIKPKKKKEAEGEKAGGETSGEKEEQAKKEKPEKKEEKEESQKEDEKKGEQSQEEKTEESSQEQK